MSVWFFGCWNAPGHTWLMPGGKLCVPRESLPGAFTEWIDGGYAPRQWMTGRHKHRGLVRNPDICFVMEGRDRLERMQINRDTEELTQGKFLHHISNGHTLMSWWDRTQGDTRGACNSNIVALGELTSVQMYDLLVEHFPSVANNLIKEKVPLIQVSADD